MPVAAPPKIAVDVKLIRPFIHSVGNVLEMMAGVKVAVGTPHVKSPADRYTVFGIIGFSGQLGGTSTVCFTHDSAAKLTEILTGAPTEAGTPEFADAIGEVANMIAGSAKGQFDLDAAITVPSVVIGDPCYITPLTGVPCIVIPCTGSIGQFAVEVCIKKTA